MQQPVPSQRPLTDFWSRFLPPARPSAADLVIYEDALDGPRARILLLGSTPELRSLAHRHGHDLVVVDADREMYLAMGDMVEMTGPETFVQDDWLRMSPDHEFDLVLGDGAVNMLPRELHRPLLETIAALLRPDGLCILHTHTLDHIPFSSIDEVVAWHRSENRGRPFFHVRDIISHFWVDPATGALANRDFLARMGALCRKGGVTEAEYLEFARILEGDPLVLHYPREEDIARGAPSCLHIERVACADDYAGGSLKPFYFLRRRG